MGISVAPYLCVSPCAEAIEFYKAAFGAEEVERLPVPTGEIGHAELRIAGSPLFLADQHPVDGWWAPAHFDGRASMVHVEVDDVDVWFDRAVAAGASPERPPASRDGRRFGLLKDPFGHTWMLSTTTGAKK